MDNLAGRTVFITGGAQGIGLGMARAFARAGANLAIVDIHREALTAARTELAKTARSVETFELDVRDRVAFSQVADAAEQHVGPVTVLCNNAGVRLPDPLPELTYELWDLVLGINLGGIYNGIQTFLPRMLARGESGHIVNTSSAAGLAIHPNAKQAGTSGITYRAAKSAVIGLSEALRFDLEAGNHPIGVSVLCPGLVDTRIASNSVGIDQDHATAQRLQYAKLGDAALSQLGQSPDSVGDLVIEAIRSNQLYVHTDNTTVEAITSRSEAILKAMP